MDHYFDMESSGEDQHEDEIEQSVLEVLPSIQSHRLTNLVTRMGRLGVTCKEDMMLLVEDDIVPILTRIEARKLISGLKVKGWYTGCPPPPPQKKKGDVRSCAGLYFNFFKKI